MKPFPHHYRVEARASASGSVDVRAEGLPAIASAPPVDFDGPGDQWSPESLLVAAVADCFVLTFRAVADASKLKWSDIRCHAEGTLDRVKRVTKFVAMHVVAELDVPAGVRVETAKRVLEKAEENCLVTSSLNCPVELDARVNAQE